MNALSRAAPSSGAAELPPIEPGALLPQLDVRTVHAAGVVARVAGQGRPLLLLHGGTGSWTHWLRNMEALAQRFRIVVPDLPGMGESLDVPLDLGLDGYAEHVLAAVQGGLLPPDEPFMVAGFSFGGLVAAWLAARLPERVEAVCLLGPGGFPAGASLRPPLQAVPSSASEQDKDAAHRRNLELLMIGEPGRIDALTVAMQRRNHRLSRFKSRRLGYVDTLAPSLRAVRCPVLCILGERDPLPQPDAASRAAYLESTSPRLSCRIVPDASHWVAYEQPDAVNRLMIDFFAGRGARGADGAFC